MKLIICLLFCCLQDFQKLCSLITYVLDKHEAHGSHHSPELQCHWVEMLQTFKLYYVGGQTDGETDRLILDKR